MAVNRLTVLLLLGLIGQMLCRSVIGPGKSIEINCTMVFQAQEEHHQRLQQRQQEEEMRKQWQKEMEGQEDVYFHPAPPMPIFDPCELYSLCGTDGLVYNSTCSFCDAQQRSPEDNKLLVHYTGHCFVGGPLPY